MNGKWGLACGMAALTLVFSGTIWGQEPVQPNPTVSLEREGTVYSTRTSRFRRPLNPANPRNSFRGNPSDSYARRSTRLVVPYRNPFDTPQRQAAVEFEKKRRLISPINRQLSDSRDTRYERQIRDSFWIQLRMR